VKSRLICFGVLLLTAAGVALGAGNYQRTKDGTVTVWNGDPKPGDAAEWFGGRDKDGYATGTGTLVWYDGKHQVYARYHGKMVRGKLDGAVDVRSRGKIAHAVFDQGRRTTRWTAGGGSQTTLTVSPPPEPAANRPDEQAAPKSETAPEQASGAATAEPRRSPSAPIESERIASVKTAEQAPNTERRPPNAEQSGENIPAEAPQTVKQQTSNPAPQSSAVASAEHRTPQAEQLKEDIPAEGPNIEKRAEKAGAQAGGEKPVPGATQPTITIQDKPDVGDLSGPPSELRMNSAAAISPPDIGPQVASAPKGAQLTPQEAMELADAEARAHGYDLAGYGRPKGDYSAVKGLWSFLYNAKDANAAVDKPPGFLVTVDDASKKAEVNR
jgi:hypothetical protein